MVVLVICRKWEGALRSSFLLLFEGLDITEAGRFRSQT
jgi:hypothetical protein